MKFRGFHLLAMILILTMMVLGCSSGNENGGTSNSAAGDTGSPSQSSGNNDGSSGEAPKERTKLTVISWWDFTQSEPLQKLKAAFEEKNPDLELEFTMVGASEYYDKLLTTIAGGGDLPDVVMLAMDRIPMFADRGAIIPLDGYADQEYLDSLYPVVLEATTFNGQVVAVARDISSKVMYLNKKMFDDAGVALPEADWTWDEFVDIARQLTKDGQWGFYFPKYMDGFTHWLVANEGGLATRDGESQLGLPQSREMLQKLHDLIHVEKVVPTDSQASQFGSGVEAPFIAGKAAMVAGSLSSTVAFNNADVEFAIRPLPKVKISANTSFVNAWAIPKGAKNPDLSWRVLEFFSSKEGQQIVLDTGMGLPASTGVDTTAFLAQHPDYVHLLESLNTSVPFPAPIHGAAFFAEVQKQLDLMWLGQKGVDESVDAVEKLAPSLLAGE